MMRVLGFLSAAAVAGLLTGAAMAADMTLKLGHVGEPGSLFAASVEEFVRRSNEALGDKAEVQVFGSSQLGNDTDLLQTLKLGQVHFALPSSVGGGQDRPTRAFAEVRENHLGVPITVEPHDGASGRVGLEYFLRQAGAKDGRYAVSTNLGTASIMYIDQEPQWNWEEELHAVNLFGPDPAAIFARKDSPFRTIEDFINIAKERPVVMGTSRWGSVETMMIHEIVDQIDGVQIQLVDTGGTIRV